MDERLKTGIWQQFGAAVDMLDDAISACPETLWTAIVWDDSDDLRYGQFWQVAYHTLFWLDLYLHGSFKGFAPPPPFNKAGLPDKPYTKAEVLNYLKQCRQKCHNVIMGLTDENAYTIHRFEWMEPTFVELQLYSMRHVQEHAAQLSLVLGHNAVTGPDWVSKARD